ncbi:hypothetical protein [Luteibacter sp. 22Crub2.1]|uniref:hypothetical protein n=1 Tax=Luteibacter sp. 22Crub2.1 TaxID=1283288 RepID=UPI001116BDDB|nr:hypothetical protein [Luteibacter sp. 22Crub2.1]
MVYRHFARVVSVAEDGVVVVVRSKVLLVGVAGSGLLLVVFALVGLVVVLFGVVVAAVLVDAVCVGAVVDPLVEGVLVVFDSVVELAQVVVVWVFSVGGLSGVVVMGWLLLGVLVAGVEQALLDVLVGVVALVVAVGVGPDAVYVFVVVVARAVVFVCGVAFAVLVGLIQSCSESAVLCLSGALRSLDRIEPVWPSLWVVSPLSLVRFGLLRALVGGLPFVVVLLVVYAFALVAFLIGAEMAVRMWFLVVFGVAGGVLAFRGEALSFVVGGALPGVLGAGVVRGILD